MFDFAPSVWPKFPEHTTYRTRMRQYGRSRPKCTETSEAFLASARDAVFRHMSGPHLGDQEHLIALTSDHAGR